MSIIFNELKERIMTTKEQITDWFCERNKIKKEELDKYHRYAISTVFKYAQEQVKNWVAVKDQLPPNESKKYLVIRDGNVDFDKWIFNGTEGYWWDYIGITHWMQIPEPPCR